MLITVAELLEYQRLADKLLASAERMDLVNYLAAFPKAGDLVTGTGGIRKLRWARGGRGRDRSRGRGRDRREERPDRSDRKPEVASTTPTAFGEAVADTIGMSGERLTRSEAFDLVRRAVESLVSGEDATSASAARRRAFELLGRDSESLSSRNFERILQDSHDANMVDLRRRGNDFEVARAADAAPIVDQLRTVELAQQAAAAASAPPAPPRGMGARGVGGRGMGGRGKGPSGPPEGLLMVGVVGPRVVPASTVASANGAGLSAPVIPSEPIAPTIAELVAVVAEAPVAEVALASEKAAPKRGRAPAKAAAAKAAPAKTVPVKAAQAKSAPAKSAPAKTAPAKTAPAKQAPAKQAPAKSAPAKQVAKTATKVVAKAPAKAATTAPTAVAAGAANSTKAPGRKAAKSGGK